MRLAKESAELSVRQALALVKSHHLGLELSSVGDGAGEDCTAVRFEELLEEVAPVAKDISEDLNM